MALFKATAFTNRAPAVLVFGHGLRSRFPAAESCLLGCGESHLYGTEGPLYYLKYGTAIRWSPAHCEEEVCSTLVSCRLSYLYLSGIYVFAASQRAKTINLVAICTPADYNTRPLDTSYSCFIDALPMVKYCSENNKHLIHLSTCEVYGKTIGSFLPTDHPMRQVFELEEKFNIFSHFDEDGDYNGAAGT
ncbi:hypothetical protein RHSIM_Rhsim11G0010100 [Rhododendron simsii]|uniref:NAD-dependent epimerase/dehydratase domain-containing protein n=1 Tax=Rhododendron simsii TaxID=118357 RepID=A0A834G915_RHOSS|nr:hypothetical protein RHSIM_Rhsim11G0010100 [Rhododendron simsii]